MHPHYWVRRGPSLVALACAVCLLVSCRERYPETEKLARARNLQSQGGGGSMSRSMTAPDGFESQLKGGKLVFSDDFERDEPGPKWKAETSQWVMTGGTVTNKHADNKGFWLLEKLPTGDVRIEFDVRSDSFTKKDRSGKSSETFPGDLKCEAFNEEPTHQTGYVFIFGGWSNKVNRIARLEEHGDGPGARVVDGPKHAVKKGHTYRMKVVRVGKTIAWYADDKYLVHMTDDKLIRGRHFGLNNWRSHLTFDNVAVYSLPAPKAPPKRTTPPNGTPKGG